MEKEKVTLSNEGKIVMSTLLGKRDHRFKRKELTKALWDKKDDFPKDWKCRVYWAISNAKKYLELHRKYSIRWYPKGQGWKLAYTEIDLEIAAKQSIIRAQSYAEAAKRKGNILEIMIQMVKTFPGIEEREAKRLIDGIKKVVQICYVVDTDLGRAIEAGELAKLESKEGTDGKSLDNKGSK